MSGIGGRQTGVNDQPAVGVAGDFCDLNPRYTYDAGPGALVAGPNGCYVGRFAWIAPPDDSNGASGVVNNFGTGSPAGFIGREQQGLNVTYLLDASLFIPAGFPVTLYTSAGFWMQNSGASQALPGQKAYANFANGRVTYAASGSPAGGGTSTSSTIAAETSSVTGSIAGNILTVTAVGSGIVYPGTTISGTGVASGTQIVAQISGTAGGIGTYYVSIPEQTVASTTISGTYGLLTVGGTVVSGFAVGDVISGSGVAAGTTITALGTGTGGAGTYVVNNNTVVASGEAINVAATNVETSFYARSSGLADELVKTTNQPVP